MHQPMLLIPKMMLVLHLPCIATRGAAAAPTLPWAMEFKGMV